MGLKFKQSAHQPKSQRTVYIESESTHSYRTANTFDGHCLTFCVLLKEMHTIRDHQCTTFLTCTIMCQNNNKKKQTYSLVQATFAWIEVCRKCLPWLNFPCPRSRNCLSAAYSLWGNLVRWAVTEHSIYNRGFSAHIWPALTRLALRAQTGERLERGEAEPLKLRFDLQRWRKGPGCSILS